MHFREKPLAFGFAALAAAVILVMLFSYRQSQGWRSELSYPMDSFADRPKLLTFGMFVTPDPAQNPVDPPERFSGYHTALDLEILPGEEETEVRVYAICTGPIRFAGTQNGYGGVVVQECAIRGQAVTVLYGHVDPAPFTLPVGAQAGQGTKIAVLAPAHSPASGDTRRHLHLGIHKGTEIQFLGYVQDESGLAEYIDPLRLFQ